jgi:phage terminase large subunit-like protein
MTIPQDFDPGVIYTWDEKSQRRAAEALQRRVEKKILAWYCTRGRICDGQPHEGYEYAHARSDQWPPPGFDWFVWLIISGRGAGKTRTGAEWLRKMSKHVGRMAMIGRRGPDVRGTMVEGPSGLIYACERAAVDYTWEPSKKEFTFGNGAKAFGYSAEEPDSLRGPQHGVAWLDEPAHMPLITEVWDMLLMGLRLDGVPGGAKVLCTSTPLPLKWLKELMKEEDTITVRVSTYANLNNLDPQFRKNVLKKYEGTRLGRQELHGEIIEDVEGALWQSQMIEDERVDEMPDQDITPFDRVIVAVDPAGTSTRRSDETGIIVLGRLAGHIYVLEDASGKYSPAAWANKVVAVFDKWQADRVIAEKNYGGEMVESTLRNVAAHLPLTMVQSRRGKALRAEPTVALYEQRKVHHVGLHEALEAQMTEWVPGDSDSPDRVDALVHGLTELGGLSAPAEIVTPTQRGSLSTDPLMHARFRTRTSSYGIASPA